MTQDTGNKKGYEKLIVWNKADKLAFDIYLATKNFPSEEMYGLTSQLRRSALSVSLNIVESTGRQNLKERKQFVNIALGSLVETEYLLNFASRLNYITKEKYQELERLRNETGALLWGYYKSF